MSVTFNEEECKRFIEAIRDFFYCPWETEKLHIDYTVEGVNIFINSLKEEHQRLLVERIVNRNTYANIAKILKISTTATRLRFHTIIRMYKNDKVKATLATGTSAANMYCDSIDMLNLPTKVRNALWDNKIRTISELKTMSATDLLRLDWFGKRSLNQLIETLKGTDIDFKVLVDDEVPVDDEMPVDDEILEDTDKPITEESDIAELGLSNRSYNCLRNANIKTVGDILQLEYWDLQRIRNLGILSIRNVIDTLGKCGIIYMPEDIPDKLIYKKNC